MPESAEVKLTTDYLEKKLDNRIIYDWVIDSGQYEDTPPVGFKEFRKNLPMFVETVQCKGKFIYFTVFNENGYFYILHSLRMTGRWQNYKDDSCRWHVTLDNDEIIWFRNPRCFATVEFTKDKSVLQEKLDNLGPDILTPEFSLEKWNQMVIDNKNKNVTAFLMNQNILSGIGNYIKSEALYYAKISPIRKIGKLSKIELGKLYEAIRIIPRIAYNKNGLSIKDYSDAYGINGSYSDELQIYGKSHAKKTKTSDGRITHWDPEVQS